MNGFFQVNQDFHRLASFDAVDSAVFIFSVFFFWRYQMEQAVRFENIEEDDFWQNNVALALDNVSQAFIRVDGAMDAWGSEKKPRRVESPRYPLRLQYHQRAALAEVMLAHASSQDDADDAKNKGADKKARPLPYVDFSMKLHDAHEGKAEKGGDFEAWVLPVRNVMKRYGDLVCRECKVTAGRELSRAEETELQAFRFRLSAIYKQVSVLDLILQKPQDDPWFRRRNTMEDEQEQFLKDY